MLNNIHDYIKNIMMVDDAHMADIILCSIDDTHKIIRNHNLETFSASAYRVADRLLFIKVDKGGIDCSKPYNITFYVDNKSHLTTIYTEIADYETIRDFNNIINLFLEAPEFKDYHFISFDIKTQKFYNDKHKIKSYNRFINSLYGLHSSVGCCISQIWTILLPSPGAIANFQSVLKDFGTDIHAFEEIFNIPTEENKDNAPKYVLTDKTIDFDGHTLYRIRATRDIPAKDHFPAIKKGDLGGFVESKYNLDQIGDCWIYSNVVVYGNAMVSGNARILGKVIMKDRAKAFGDCEIWSWHIVKSEPPAGHFIPAEDDDVNLYIEDCAYIFGHAKISGAGVIGGNGCICGNAELHGMTYIKEEVRLMGGEFNHFKK